MLKKFILVCMLIIILLPSSIISYASYDSESITEIDSQLMINDLEKYVSFDNNNIELKVPQELVNKYGLENIQAFENGIKDLNNLADSGEMVITDNGTIYETSDDDFVIQGGANKIINHWWGNASYMSTIRARDFVNINRNVAISTVAIGALSAYFTFGVGFVFGTVGTAYYSILANNVENRNAGHTKGIILNMHYTATYTTERQ